jgi:hypothetical protein
LPVITLFFRQFYVFFIIELASRRVVHCGVTDSPTDAWTAQQLREATPFGQAPKYLIRDNDSKYGATFAHVACAGYQAHPFTPEHVGALNRREASCRCRGALVTKRTDRGFDLLRHFCVSRGRPQIECDKKRPAFTSMLTG